ncbi:MAG TPA: class I SAM-dependent methyltransferase [Alphaproteobacteria bacterium]
MAQGIRLRGRILDIGGGIRADYYALMKIDGQIDSVNINPAYKPTFLCDANEKLPIPDATYDAVLSFNTFEHILNDEVAIAEAIRVLKPGGEFHFFVPFLYRVHGSPSDFHRHTHYWWEHKLAQLGIPPTAQTIEPIVWEPAASAFSLVELTRFRRFVKPIALAIGPLRTWRFAGQERLAGAAAEYFTAHALGYYLRGAKPAI